MTRPTEKTRKLALSDTNYFILYATLVKIYISEIIKFGMHFGHSFYSIESIEFVVSWEAL